MKKITIKRCPKCKSLKIDLFAGGYTGSYNCLDCGYIGPFIIEEDVDESELKK